MAILPGSLEPLASVAPTPKGAEELPEPLLTHFSEVSLALQYGKIHPDITITLLESLPQETLRNLVHRVAGLENSFLMTFSKQVRLIDAVLNQLVYPDGRLKESIPEHLDISLKDALNMSLRISQIMVRDLPKLMGMDRLQRMEQALGDVMEEMLTKEQQAKVLSRIQELSS
jgi:hypothetical protein